MSGVTRAFAIGLLAIGLLATLGLTGGRARAEDRAELPGVSAARAAADRVDTDIARMRRDLGTVRDGYNIRVAPEIGKIERRLREAEIHFLLNDYLRAAIVLLDVVDVPGHRSHPSYPECLFVLAESLRMSRNYSGARRYYEQVLPGARGSRLEDTVLGLLHVASETDQYQDVDRYIARLRQAGTLARPDVDYIYGKMLYRQGLTDPAKMAAAHAVFRQVPSKSAAGARASYYAGVALVQMGRYPEAIEQFWSTVSIVNADAPADPLRDLTYLSLGRLYQELGHVTKSADTYQEISQASPYFPDMLYEVAWVHVTRANQLAEPEERKAAFRHALRATELLMAAAPGSRLYPRARLLQGNLQIRLGAPETAYETFQVIVDHYGGARDKVLAMAEHRTDARRFFEDLLSTDVDHVNVQGVLPPLAVTWALEEGDMDRAVAMHRGLSESERDLAESRELIETLNAALEGEQRFSMFPGVREPRSVAISIENRLLSANQVILDLERSLVTPHLSPAEAAELEEARRRSKRIEAEIAALPMSGEAVDSSRSELKKAYQAVSRQAHRYTYQTGSMNAQLVAVERWLRDHRASLTVQGAELMEERLIHARAEIRVLENALAAIQADLRKGEALVEGEAGSSRSLRLERAYAEAVFQETALLARYRGKAPEVVMGLFSRIDQQRRALSELDGDLERLQAGLEAKVAGRVVEIQRAVAVELRKIRGYGREHHTLSGRSRALLGPVAERTLDAVSAQFNDLVLKADVGIIDVAWARKREETDRVSELIREQQQRTQEFESEFADVLGE